MPAPVRPSQRRKVPSCEPLTDLAAARREGHGHHCPTMAYQGIAERLARTCIPEAQRCIRRTAYYDILSGQSGADAHHYQEREVKRAIAATQNAKS